MVTRRLYADLRPRSLASLVLLFRTLQWNVTLREHARTLDIRLCGLPPTPLTLPILWLTARQAASTRLFHRLLLSLPRLERLIFPLRSYLWNPTLLRTSLPKTVNTLELDTHHETLNAHVYFFVDMPQLKELTFHGWIHDDWQCLYKLQRFGRTVLPHLEVLNAPTVVVNVLVGGRPVTRICIDGAVDREHFAQSVRNWAGSTGPVRFLKIELKMLGQEEIAEICNHLPALESLELINKRLDGAQVVGAFTTRAALTSLSALSRLSHLSICTSTFADLPNRDYYPFVFALSHACVALREVLLDGRTGTAWHIFAKIRFTRVEVESREEGTSVLWRKEERLVKRMWG
ncbi:hypothetical protein CALVIDRAFT_109440 [Calocera viscosa TUFC12733]|uniref:F-box domain-containing protein n=1 Tax=Calocera viscosa (strain TUFC12733) TaxID=1330018 RepID=A0A167MEZ8_CALVF|nr:hypothetical protein CALVIDRAFT_109440 [Calocera viscosa TUFC12733]